MIDLNYKPKKTEQEEKDPPTIVMLILLLPFAVLFWIVLMTAFINGIY